MISIEIIREIKETFRVGVRDELRKEAKRYSMREDLYTNKE